MAEEYLKMSREEVDRLSIVQLVVRSHYRPWTRATLPPTPHRMERRAFTKPWNKPKRVRMLALATKRYRTTHGDNGPKSPWIRPFSNKRHSLKGILSGLG